jgi:hypothetical protein
METSIGKVTGDGSTHSARCCRAGYQSQGSPSRTKDNEIPTDRGLAGSQRGVKHFVSKRNGTSSEARLSSFYNAIFNYEKLKDKQKTSDVDSERCLILQTLVNEVIRETASLLMSITKYLVGRPSLRELARLYRVE